MENAITPNPLLSMRSMLNTRTQRVLHHPIFWIGILLFIGLTLFCFVGPTLYTASPFTIHVTWIGHAPSKQLPLGADRLGRNELARLMLGGQLLILVGVASAIAATLGGTMLGLAAGLLGGATDRVLTWVTDVVFGIPQLVPLLLIDALLRPNALTMIFVVAATTWPVIARLVRAEVLSVRERDYVIAARSMGASDLRILGRHILPNVWDTVMVATSNQVGNAVLVIATASFLGFGLPPPWPNWAGMIANSTVDIWNGYWWIMLFPGVAFALLQLSVNFIADALREAFPIQGEVP